MRRMIIASFVLCLTLFPSPALAQNDIITTFAGSGPNNLAATSANVDQPTSVAVAPSGVFYIASPAQNRVFKVDPSSTPQFTVFAGNGTPGYSGDTGLAVNAALRSPQAVAVDSLGNVFIADTQNNVVRKVDSSGTITTVAGNGGSGFSGDGGAAISAKLARPFGLAIDSTGNIYIADIDNNRVRKVDTAGTITTFAGNGAAGFGGDGGPPTVASLNQPMSVALDGSGNLYISDSGNHRVRKVTSGVITTFAGNGGVSSACTTPSLTGPVPVSGPPTTLSLSDRTGLAVAAGNVFIADTDDGCVREVTGGMMTTVAGSGSFGFSGDGSSATAASLNGPLGVAADSGGNIFIADTGNHRVREVTSGTISTVAGNGLTYVINPFLALNVGLNSPQGVAIDGTGNVFIADTGESLIRAVNTQATPITVTGVVIQPGTMATVAGIGSFGFSGDGFAATSAILNGPTGVAEDTLGNIFIADASNQCIRKVSTIGTITTVAGNGTACANPTASCGDGFPATSANLNFPSSVAVDGFGNFFIADTDNHRVRAVNVKATAITVAGVLIQPGNIATVAGNGCNGFAVGNPPSCNTTNDVTAGDGVPAVRASLNFPSEVVLDTLGNLYIADQSNHRVREVSTSGNITTVAGNGTAGFSGDGAGATSAMLNFPAAVALDGLGNLFIADFGNQRTRRVDAGTQVITTVAGDGSFGFSGDNGVATLAMLANPTGLTVDGSGNLFIADTFNNRIRKVANPVVPAVSLSATSLLFPVQLFGTTSAPLTLTLFNTGNAALSISSIAIITGDFGQTNNCGSSLAAGTNCSISVTFTPTGLGSRAGSLSINDDAQGSPQVINLSGTGVQPTAIPSPTSLTFSNQLVGTTSAAQPVTLSNTGTATLAITSILPSGDFAVTANTCGSTLAVSTTCTFGVTFTPITTGSRTGAVTLTDNAGDSPQMINLTGTGIAPSIALSTSNLTFGNQEVGSTTLPMGVALTSTGTAPLLISSIAATGDFAETNNCGTSVAPPTTCTINVTFTPTATGSRLGTLIINDDASGSPQTVTLSGTGVPPTLALSPTSLDFGTQGITTTSSPQGVALTSTGIAPLLITSIAASGDFAQTNNCGLSVPPLTTCTINVTFTPTATGARSGTLTITDNGANSPQTVALTGTGTVVVLAPNTLAFPNQLIGSASAPLMLTLTNLGSSPLNITSVDITGDFGGSNNCPASLAPGASCAIKVIFQPTFAGPQVGTLSVIDSDPAIPQKVTLNGTGVPSTAVLSNTSLIFLSQTIGTTSSSQGLTLTNNGTAPLAVNSVAISGDFAQTNNCPVPPATLAPGAICAFSVTFTPTAGGARNGSLTIIESADPNTPRIVNLAGNGFGEGVSLSQPSLSFSFPQEVGSTSGSLPLTLTSTGTVPLTISSISTSGDFSVSTGAPGNCGGSLAIGATCTVNVMFAPTALGIRTGTLTINDGAATSPEMVSLSGTGVPPTLALSPTSLDFGTQGITTTSSPQGVALTSTGAAPLLITSIAASGDFAQTNNCGLSVPPLTTCAINVTFTPTATGARSGTLTVTDNGANTPQTVALTGTGVGPSFSLSQTSLVFQNSQGIGTTSGALPLALSSTSTAPLTINSIVMSGDFTQTNNCPVPPQLSTNCTINVTFTPTATGARSGTLTVMSNVAGPPPVIPLSGSGVAGYAMTVDRTSATVLKGTDSAVFNVSATSQFNFLGSISLSCSGNAPTVCSFNPTSITAGQNSVLTVTGLSAVSSSALNFTVTGTSGSQSSSLAITIFVADFSISASSPTATVTAGQTATYTLTIQPSGGFSLPISLNCSGAPLAATCSISPSSISPDGINPFPVTVTVTTTAISVAEVPGRFTIQGARGPRGLPLFFGLVFASGIALYFSLRRRQVRFLLAMLVLSATTWIACGGGGSGPLPILKGTPSGTYTLSVSAASGNLSHNINLGLTVN